MRKVHVLTSQPQEEAAGSLRRQSARQAGASSHRGSRCLGHAAGQPRLRTLVMFFQRLHENELASQALKGPK